MKQSPEEIRRVLGIVYCPACKVDTMPSERTGECFFCGSQIIAVDALRDLTQDYPLCKNGLHPMTPANTIVRSDRGHYVRCLECRKLSRRKWTDKRRAA